MKSYTIVITFQAKPGKERALQQFLESIIVIALQSPGCLQHGLHQSFGDPATFMFYENWTNKEAHENHVARPEVQKWRSQLDGFLAKPYEASFWQGL